MSSQQFETFEKEGKTNIHERFSFLFMIGFIIFSLLSIIFIILFFNKSPIISIKSNKTIIGIAGNQQIIPFYEPYNIFGESSISCFIRPFHKLNTQLRIFPVLDNFTENDIKIQIDGIHGLVLQGGADITPSLYNEINLPLLGTINTKMDLFHIALYKEAKKRNIPIFGFCRGFQLMNVIENGSMYQDQSYYDLPIGKTSVNHRILTNITDPVHIIDLEDNSIIKSLFKKNQLFVNSVHHQYVKKVGEIFKVTGRCHDDGVPEVVERKDGGSFMMGTQFHPEFMTWKNDEMMIIFEKYVEEATKFRNSLN